MDLSLRHQAISRGDGGGGGVGRRVVALDDEDVFLVEAGEVTEKMVNLSVLSLDGEEED